MAVSCHSSFPLDYHHKACLPWCANNPDNNCLRCKCKACKLCHSSPRSSRSQQPKHIGQKALLRPSQLPPLSPLPPPPPPPRPCPQLEHGTRPPLLQGDELLQPCSDSPKLAANRDIEDALLSKRCPSDAAAFVVNEIEQPKFHKTIPSGSRVAVATLAHRPHRTARFLENGKNATDDVLPCIVILQALALRHMGGFGQDIDIVTVHSNLLPSQLDAIAARGIKLHHAGQLPDPELYGGSEFEAANMLKVDVAGLRDYERVLYIDIDMLPRERTVQHLLVEYPEQLVGFPGPSTPVSGQLFVLRPQARMHALLRRLARTRNFTVARGWEETGLLTWPDADASDAHAQCNATYAINGAHAAPALGSRRRRCALWPFWIERCRRHRLTNWNFMHAGSDQVRAP